MYKADNTDVLVIGAGFAGATAARELAEAGLQVLLIDKRDHIAGNAYDELDSQGILIHRYGPHIFHTNAERIITWLSRFTDWRSYEHRVLAEVDGMLLPLPINRTTINQLYGLDLDEAGVSDHFKLVRCDRSEIKNSEDLVLSSVGKELCEKFYRGYTKKQWGLDLSQLNSSVAARIPIRCNIDDRYFEDKFQLMPKAGYTKLFQRILDHPRINIQLGSFFRKTECHITRRHTIFTGPLDEYFNYCFGPLAYRSIKFKHEKHTDTEFYQKVGTINYPNNHHYTRITEFKHITGQKHSSTSIVKEFPTSGGDPYYPIPTMASDDLRKRYQKLAQEEKNVTFVGRLAQYRYYNMDQVVGAALAIAVSVVARLQK